MAVKPYNVFLSSFSIAMLLGTYAAPITISAATKTYSFSASPEQTQTQTFTLPSDLVSINSLKVNTGEASYSIEGGKIKITVSNGDAVSKESFYNDKLQLLPDYTATIYSDTNNFNNTIVYETPDGYSGSLSLINSPYLTSGELIPGAQMNVSVTQKSSVNNFPATILYDKDDFKGTLSKTGSTGRTLVSGGSYTKDSKTATTTLQNSSNSFGSTTVYDDGTYRGTISKSGSSTQYVASGSYTAAQTKTVTQTKTSSTNSFASTISYSSGGYSGTLSKSGSVTSKLVSGSYTPAQTKTITNYQKTSTNRKDYFTCTKDGWSAGVAKPDLNTPARTIKYNSGGYSGTLERKYINITNQKQLITGMDCEPAIYGKEYAFKSYTSNYYYEGTVTKPAVDTRVYSYTQTYTGTVTKPAVDTRVYAYKQNYSGEATRYLKVTDTLQSDTNSFPSSITYENQNGYKGTLSKSGSSVLDVDVYEQEYTGYIYSQTVDNTEYEYSQTYNGTVSQENEDTRVWAADYTGTLYKGGNDYTNQKYAYTVTLDYETEKTSNCSYLGVSPPSTTILNYKPKCTKLDDGTDNLYSFYYDFKVTGISNIQAGKH